MRSSWASPQRRFMATPMYASEQTAHAHCAYSSLLASMADKQPDARLAWRAAALFRCFPNPKESS